MNRARGSLGATLGLALVAAATTWFAMLSWRGFTLESAKFLGPLLVIGVVIAGTGALARWWRVPGGLVVLLQVLLSAMLVSLILCGSPIPVGPAWQELVTSFQQAVDTSNRYAAPVPRNAPGVEPLLIAGGWACLLLVDGLTCTLRRVPLAGLPLLTVYSVPISLLGGGLSWWIFGLTAAGFLAMLYLHENEQVARWGRPLGADPETTDPTAFGVRTGALRTSAGAIGGVATALAVFLPLLIPTLNVQLFDFGNGPGGDNDIHLDNPMTDLKRDLVRADDIPLVQVTTNDPHPSYLRVAVLNRYSDSEWSSGDREVPTNNLADGEMPPLLGVQSGVNRVSYNYGVTIDNSFDATWLPTQAPITSIVANGDWRYDPATMDFIAGDEGMSTAGMSYAMTGVQLELSANDLASAPSSAGVVASEFTDLPPGIPSFVRDLANGVTRDAPTRFQKAVALQQWFRSDGGFTYDTSVAKGNGTDALVAFLTDAEGGRTGYCEQFASAMAVMARMLGIPARVAVGFLEARPLGRNLWEYSAHDLHAWPELFFQGAGWVRFEPTPPGRASGVPDYTQQQVPVINPTGGPTGVLTEDPTRGAAPVRDSPSPAPGAADEAGGAVGSRFPWLLTVGGAVGASLVLAGLLVPRLTRRRRRERRLNAGPEDAWAELRASARDLRVPWPESRSPRDTRDHLVESFGRPVDEYTPERPAHGAQLAPDAVVALDRIVRSLELLRYSRDQSAGAGSLRAEVMTCVAALEGGATRRSRRAALWWPRSVLVRPRLKLRRSGGATVETRFGGVVDHVG
ncbi:MAG: transglutaminase domain protein [Nocardioides sp.]|nr:transglutaminase domain protein [Nocardioides sp.]